MRRRRASWLAWLLLGGLLLGGAALPLRLQGVVPLPMGIPRELALSADGRTAFVANDEGWTVVAVDLSDPRHPVLAGVGSTGGFASSVAVQGDRVLVSDSRSAVHTLQFRPGSGPWRALPQVDARPFAKPRLVLVAGGRVFVGGPGGVEGIPGLGEPLAAWASKGRVYVGGQQGGSWVVWEVTGPPRRVAALPGCVTAADSDGRFLCLARGAAVETLDVSGGALRAVGTLQAPSPVVKARVWGGRAWLSGAVLAVVDLAGGKVLASVSARPNAGTYAVRQPAFVDALPCAGGCVAALDRFWGLRILRGDTLEEVAVRLTAP